MPRYRVLCALLRAGRWGRVPVTQLQLEVHVAARTSDPYWSSALVHSYGTRGLLRAPAHGLIGYRGGNRSGTAGLSGRSMAAHRKFLQWNNPQAVRQDRRARRMLKALLAHGFVPFHIDFGDADGAERSTCCSVEYTFLNTRAPQYRLPKFQLGL